ncbi:P-loop NTPase fold protein [Stenotrophomonas maltophilia group sp. RY12688]|uniref:P-loop NTPase fold protein n=1 Tax=Stenotrophomonas maltophilia group sp. RY12688 TaxID=3454438 RepID=UPI003F94918E
MGAVSPDEALAGVAAIERDRLQRSCFAAAATSALDRVSSTAGFVISIERSWGSGKTSALVMMEHLIRVAQMSFSFSGAFWPTSFPFFQGSKGSGV